MVFLTSREKKALGMSLNENFANSLRLKKLPQSVYFSEDDDILPKACLEFSLSFLQGLL